MSEPTLSHRIRPMSGRNPAEVHRTATPLELLFDLAFVAAFGIAADEFAHGVAAGHVGPALGGFAFAMFAIIWAWINFTWFASAFDTDDWFYRLTTMVQMVGVVVLALGLSDVFGSLDAGTGLDNRVLVAGYVVMRVAMVTQWLRLARQSPEYRPVAVRFVAFISVAQVGWVVLALLPLGLGATMAFAAVLYAIELAGPLYTELRLGTPWHPHHVAERYGLLTLIALGEGVLGTIASVQPFVAGHGWTVDTVTLVGAGVLLTFGLWWSYFMVPFGEILARNRSAVFVFGYGHLPLFAAIAAVGAGLHVGAYVVEGEAELGFVGAVLSVAIPVAVFMLVEFAIYSALVRSVDRFHGWLLVGVLAALVAAVLLAAAGVGFGICVLIVALAPAVVVVGFETVGHRHSAEHLQRLAHDSEPH